MAVDLPSSDAYNFLWVDGSSGGTPLSALDLNAEETQIFSFVTAVANYILSFVAANYGPGSGSTGVPVNIARPVIS